MRRDDRERRVAKGRVAYLDEHGHVEKVPRVAEIPRWALQAAQAGDRRGFQDSDTYMYIYTYK